METKASTRIRRLREESGLNRKEFADHVGIPLRTIEDWEAGKRKPPEKPELYRVQGKLLL